MRFDLFNEYSSLFILGTSVSRKRPVQYSAAYARPAKAGTFANLIIDLISLLKRFGARATGQEDVTRVVELNDHLRRDVDPEWHRVETDNSNSTPPMLSSRDDVERCKLFI